MIARHNRCQNTGGSEVASLVMHLQNHPQLELIMRNPQLSKMVKWN